MAARRPRLPMLLGLATLTTAAHALASAAHLAGGHADWRDWPLLALLGLAPFAGVLLALRGRPRHGALVLAATMAVAAAATLHAHFVAPGDAVDTAAYAWVVQMTLAFELQGAALGLALVVKPQAPRAAADALG